MMRYLILASVIVLSVLLAGCGSEGEAPPAAKAGETSSAKTGREAGGPKGLSPEDLSVPKGSADAFKPGSKVGG